MNAHIQVVVGAAIVDGGRVLAARRIGPPALAGKWELPGGKVDAGETDEAALVRECREELGIDVILGRRVGGDWPIGEHGQLRTWLATISNGEPELRDHSEFRWLRIDELFDVDWLPADLPIIEKLASLMLDIVSADDENLGGVVRLPGGNVGGAVRIGATVRRPTGPWTPAVHALLAHLDAAGLDAIPKVRGIDRERREILDYAPGDTADAHDPWPTWVWSDALLVQAAQWLRRYHGAVADFRAENITTWRFSDRPLQPDEIICHHDVAPYNVVVAFDSAGEPKLRCVIDWDVAGPAKPIDDLAFMAWNFLPCWESCRDTEVVRRLRLLAHSYGGVSASDLLDRIEPRFGSAVETIFAHAAAGDVGMQNLVDGGHADQNVIALEFFRARLPHLRALLQDGPEHT
ncbi:MAG: NUDIX domain-containing protein [Acidothermaceae bacterium]